MTVKRIKPLANACLLCTGILAATTALNACSDFLEPENKAAIEAEGYFQTDEGQQALRVVMYNGMKALATNTALTEQGTDLYVASRGVSAGISCLQISVAYLHRGWNGQPLGGLIGLGRSPCRVERWSLTPDLGTGIASNRPLV